MRDRLSELCANASPTICERCTSDVMVRCVELSLTTGKTADYVSFEARAHIISESKSAAAATARESSALRLRARFDADQRCTTEGNCAAMLSILRRKSATTRWSPEDRSLQNVSARERHKEEGG